MTIVSIDPTTGLVVAEVAEPSTADEVAEACAAAAVAAPSYAAGGRALRSAVLRAAADALEGARAQIVELGIRETGLPRPRLEGELTRTVFQARHFADVVDDGAFLEATIDHAGDTPMGPGPDLRRILVPLGPVAVFGASNFPLAFSVPGGDTVSALAAGCPVVVKGHESHPALSVLVHRLLSEAASAAGAPEGLIGLVMGRQAGIDLVSDPRITAVGFTGSLGGGRALMDAIARRPDPIPFFGELASLNPVVISPGAAAARGDDLADGLFASVTGSGGQLCTKPGLVMVPSTSAGDRLVDRLAGQIAEAAPAVLLNAGIRDAYLAVAGEEVLAEAGPTAAPGFQVAPRLAQVTPESLTSVPVEECFGPITTVVRYRPGTEATLIEPLPGSLTATILAEDDEQDLVAELTGMLLPKAGRLLYAGFPTGVLVAWAQHHGGPWPATNTQHTSVGTSAVRRFMRPATWQSAPWWILPPELRDDASDVPRRVDGTLVVPGAR